MSIMFGVVLLVDDQHIEAKKLLVAFEAIRATLQGNSTTGSPEAVMKDIKQVKTRTEALLAQFIGACSIPEEGRGIGKARQLQKERKSERPKGM